MLTLLLIESFRRATGRPILGLGKEEAPSLEISDAPRALFEAPLAILAHGGGDGGGGAADPAFTYASAAALEIFQAPSWGDLVGLPSRLSAEDEPAVQADRAALLASSAASPAGFVTGYRGWRVGRGGRRFEIQDGTLWQVTSPSDECVGQAVVFTRALFEDGSEWRAGGEVEGVEGGEVAGVEGGEAAGVEGGGAAGVEGEEAAAG